LRSSTRECRLELDLHVGGRPRRAQSTSHCSTRSRGSDHVAGDHSCRRDTCVCRSCKGNSSKAACDQRCGHGRNYPSLHDALPFFRRLWAPRFAGHALLALPPQRAVTDASHGIAGEEDIVDDEPEFLVRWRLQPTAVSRAPRCAADSGHDRADPSRSKPNYGRSKPNHGEEAEDDPTSLSVPGVRACHSRTAIPRSRTHSGPAPAAAFKSRPGHTDEPNCRA
jgi:hypothetical protein